MRVPNRPMAIVSPGWLILAQTLHTTAPAPGEDRHASCVIVCSARNRTRKSDRGVSSKKLNEIAWPDNCRMAELEEPMRLQFRAMTILALGLTLSFAMPALAENGVVYFCRSNQGGLRMVGASEPCRSHETRVQWKTASTQGTAGPQGLQGPAGSQGLPGIAGAVGPQGPAGP